MLRPSSQQKHHQCLSSIHWCLLLPFILISSRETSLWWLNWKYAFKVFLTRLNSHPVKVKRHDWLFQNSTCAVLSHFSHEFQTPSARKTAGLGGTLLILTQRTWKNCFPHSATPLYLFPTNNLFVKLQMGVTPPPYSQKLLCRIISRIKERTSCGAALAMTARSLTCGRRWGQNEAG